MLPEIWIFTVCSTVCPGDDELGRKLASPAKVATIDLTPIVVDVRLHVPAEAGAEQVAPVPSDTVTVPIGVPAPGATGRYGLAEESAYFFAIGGTTDDNDARNTVWQILR